MAKGDLPEAPALSPVLAAPTKDVAVQAPSRPVDGRLTVTSIGYRVIPHFRTYSYQLPGQSHTTCYGSGTYLGNTSTATADCSTVTTLPQERQSTIGYVEIYNQVEANGLVYTLRCTRSWTGVIVPGSYRAIRSGLRSRTPRCGSPPIAVGTWARKFMRSINCSMFGDGLERTNNDWTSGI
jgi:hypothetical protein